MEIEKLITRFEVWMRLTQGHLDHLCEIIEDEASFLRSIGLIDELTVKASSAHLSAMQNLHDLRKEIEESPINLLKRE